MKKLFTKILISAVMVAIFLAPVSTSFQKNKEGDLAFNTKINTVLAQANPTTSTGPVGCTQGQTTPCFDVTQIQVSADAAIISVTVKNTLPGEDMLLEGKLRKKINGVIPQATDADIEEALTQNTPSQNIVLTFSQSLNVALIPNTPYNLEIQIKKSNIPIPDEFQKSTYDFISGSTTNPINTTTNPIATTGNPTPPDESFNCDTIITSFKECLVSTFYFLTWKPVAWIASGAAAVLDFFIYYSTQSASYSGSFIGSAWASVRDIANIFFIVALLYVAIQTILGMGHHGKNTIAIIVVVALLINFSLFFTQVIIDSSNILAKVFYNHIDAKDANGKELVGGNGQKSVTVSLISAFNPQTMIAKTATPGTAFLTILISTALMIFMIIMFLSVALLFVGRVAGLWIAMIFSPIAFASFTMPIDIPGLGHKEWLDSLMKQAFMAPIFIFFLYVIILLGKSFQLITYTISSSTSSDPLLDGVMKVVIPFLLIFILIREAKNIAVKFSGEMGQMFTKVGGFAMGAVGGAAALVGTAGIGKLAGLAAKSTVLQETAEKKGMAGFGARMALRTADYGTKATFDIRKSPVGSMLASQGIDLKSGTGMIGLGENVTTGGYKGVVAKRQAKIESEKDLYKTKMTDTEVQAWSKEKAAAYEIKKASEQKRLGTRFDQKIFEEMNGKKPEFTTAAQLNRARLVTFKENIGKTGILHSAATSIVAKVNPVTPEQLKAEQAKNPAVTFSSLNESRVLKTKLAIGVAATVATGGIAGGLGGVGALIGAGVGGGSYAVNEFTLNRDAEKGAQGAIAKEIGKGDKIEKETAKLNEDKERLEKVVGKFEEEKGKLTKDEIDNITLRDDGKITSEEYINHELEKVEGILDEGKNLKNEISTLEKNLSSASKTSSYGATSDFEKMSEKIKVLKAKEQDPISKQEITKAAIRKFELIKAKSAPKELMGINTRMETIEAKTAHPKEAHGADSGIKDAAKASGGGGGGGHAKPAAGGGGGGGHH